jgi:hypothetical protein
VVLLIKTLGSITGIQHLSLKYMSGSRDFYPFQAVADAVNNAHSLITLKVTVLRDPRHADQSGIVALATALRKHTALQEFRWFGWVSPQEAQQDTFFLDPVLRALPACPHLRNTIIMTKCASAHAMKNLLHLHAFGFSNEHGALVGGGR